MSILAKHTVGKGGPDKVFKISGMAKARAAEVGKENIVNAGSIQGNNKLQILLGVLFVAGLITGIVFLNKFYIFNSK